VIFFNTALPYFIRKLLVPLASWRFNEERLTAKDAKNAKRLSASKPRGGLHIIPVHSRDNWCLTPAAGLIILES
jgi:hypothetical protein